jgi:hypothetical protein
MKLRRAARVFCCALVLGSVSCTAGAAISGYPRSHIDRPYTLPAGVHTWATRAAGAYARDDFASTTFIPIPWPLFWGVPLSDEWTLGLSPVPSSISRQIVRTDDQLLGATLSWPLAFGSQGVLIAPFLTVSHRLRLSRSWAWATAASGIVSRWTDQGSWGWNASAGAGPLWQVTEMLWLQPGVALSVGRTNLLLSGLPLMPAPRWVVPVGLQAGLSLARQWDLDASFTYDSIGYESGYRRYAASLALVHFW